MASPGPPARSHRLTGYSQNVALIPICRWLGAWQMRLQRAHDAICARPDTNRPHRVTAPAPSTNPAVRAGELRSQLTGLTVRRSQVGAASPTRAAGVISARRAGSVPPAFGLRRQGRSKRPMGVSPGPQFEFRLAPVLFRLKARNAFTPRKFARRLWACPTPSQTSPQSPPRQLITPPCLSPRPRCIGCSRTLSSRP